MKDKVKEGGEFDLKDQAMGGSIHTTTRERNLSLVKIILTTKEANQTTPAIEPPSRGISIMSWWIMVVLTTISCIACLTVSLATVIVCVMRKSSGSINSRS